MKVTFKKSVPVFKSVELRDPTVADYIAAERVATDTKSTNFVLALLAQVGTFDGQRRVMEDLHQLSVADFFDISNALMQGGLSELAAHLSSSAESPTSASPKSKP